MRAQPGQQVQPEPALRHRRDKIRECVEAFHKNEDTAPGIQVPVVDCETKTGNGRATFYGGVLFRFFIDAMAPKVKLRLAAEELERKSGEIGKIETFGNLYFRSCAATVPFHQGEASVRSGDVTGELAKMLNEGIADPKVYASTLQQMRLGERELR